MRAFRYVVVDVFTDAPLHGNQLAVFTDARDLNDPLMQSLARETNLSETAFVLPARGEGHARLRIFTPSAELRFAGHPVLGTAFVLAAPMQLGEIRLETEAGLVPVRLERDGSRVVFGWMEQPLPRWEPYARADEVVAALRGPQPGAPVELYDLGVQHVVVELGSPEEVAALDPDLSALRQHELGVSCVAKVGEGRWKSRMFAPGLGVAEDPATGSAAGPVAVHLARHGRSGWGERVVIEQGAEVRRPSTLHVRAAGSAERLERVEVGGEAVAVARGEFRLP